MSFFNSNNAVNNIDADFLGNVSNIDVQLPCETSLTIRNKNDFVGSKRSYILGDACHLIQLEVVDKTLFIRCDPQDHEQFKRIMVVLTLPNTSDVAIENSCKQRLLTSLETRKQPDMIKLINRSDAGLNFVGLAKNACIHTYAAGYVTARNLYSKKVDVFIDDASTASISIQTDHKVECDNFGNGRLYVYTSRKPKQIPDNPRLIYVETLGVNRNTL